MEWCVVKTGAELFDLLHAYGLGILLAHACGQPVEVMDTGCSYPLAGHVSALPCGTFDLVDEALALPTPQEVAATRLLDAGVPVPVANLDGLLTVLFTTPGAVRALSVADLLWKARRDDSTASRAIGKARLALARWKDFVSKEPSHGAESWFECVLRDYDPVAPAIPVPADARTERDLSLVMMLDASFSYSTHRPRSDGLVSHKTQVAMRGTRFAVLLAQVGAARFLRAQRVGGDLVNCYVPRADRIRLDGDTRLPLLAGTSLEASQAALVQWLVYAGGAVHVAQAQWTGLAYQTIQTQGTQQSIPRGQGYLDLSWLASLPEQSREPLRSFWGALLDLSPERRPCEVDALSTKSQSRWEVHLLEVARRIHAAPAALRSYTLAEVKEVTTHMQTSSPALLKKALEQKAGTLRFGQALRLLGEFNAAALRDLVEDLETVTTLEHLISVLAHAVQACQLAAAKTRFMVVPDEDDLGPLLLDVEQASPQTIARFLVLLSALRYPRLTEQQQDAGRLTRLVLLLTAALATLLPVDEEDQSAPALASSNETAQAPEQDMTPAVNRQHREEDNHA
jgi:hypothetical protein